MPSLYLMEHPAVLLPGRSPQLRDVFHHDLDRVGMLASGWRPRYKDRFIIITSVMDLLAWLDAVGDRRLALDLETNDGDVDMVGLAYSAEDACLIFLPDPELLTELLCRLRGREIIVHYGEGLEMPWLLDIYGDEDPPFIVHDLHKLFHAWDPEYAYAGMDDDGRGGGSGALAFVQSLFSWRPYHKHLLAVANGDRALKAHYCMLDCVVTWECFRRIESFLKTHLPETYAAYLRDAVPLLPIMARMTREGWATDEELFKRRRGELREQVKAQGEALVVEYGEEIKPKGKKAKTLVSMAGLKKILAARGVKLPLEKRADGRRTPSLGREARQKLFGKHPELRSLDAYFETQDRLSDFYKDGIIGKDGRCHASWSGYEKSWRWRCTGPNLTQFPEEDRDFFIADPGCDLVSFDTSAGEYRWFAGECGDPGLLAVFREYDRTHDPRTHPHVVNTSLLFGVPQEEAAQWKSSDDPKLKAKYVFSKNYIYRLLYSYEGGIDELRAAAAKSGLKFSAADIEALDRVWFTQYPKAKAWRERQAAAVYRTRMVTCREWGYTRRIHGQVASKIKNVGLNHVEQAGIAGIVNRTIREVYCCYHIVPRKNAHDGLVYNVPKALSAEFVPFVVASMQRPLPTLGGMVIPVDVKVGERDGAGLKEWKA